VKSVGNITKDLILKKYSNTAMNVTVVRLAEILLSRAESKLMLDYPHESIFEDLNRVTERAELPSNASCDNHDELLNSIRQQRNIELGFEGDRFHEVKRIQGTFESELGIFEWDDPKLVYPIPQQEMDQNYGWGDSGVPKSYFYPYNSQTRRRGNENAPDITKLPEVEKGYHLTDQLTDLTLDWIDKNYVSKKSKKPFFIYLSHYEVHTPFEGKLDLEEKYKGLVI